MNATQDDFTHLRTCIHAPIQAGLYTVIRADDLARMLKEVSDVSNEGMFYFDATEFPLFLYGQLDGCHTSPFSLHQYDDFEDLVIDAGAFIKMQEFECKVKEVFGDFLVDLEPDGDASDFVHFLWYLFYESRDFAVEEYTHNTDLIKRVFRMLEELTVSDIRTQLEKIDKEIDQLPVILGFSDSFYDYVTKYPKEIVRKEQVVFYCRCGTPFYATDFRYIKPLSQRGEHILNKYSLLKFKN